MQNPFLITFLIAMMFHSEISFGFDEKNLGPMHCQKGRIRYLLNGVKTGEKVEYCFDPQFQLFYSKSCHPARHCSAMNERLFKVPIISDLHSAQGKPGFKICHALGGQPLLIEFETLPNSWQFHDRCLFPSDGSFVNTGWLWQIFENKMSKNKS